MASRLSSLRVRPASIGLAVMVCGFACLQGAQAPKVAPSGTLALSAEGAEGSGAQAPFGVVFAAPQGQTTDPTEVTLVFNRPMRPLDLAGAEAPSPAVLSPAVKGSWRWVGTSALKFVPEGQLPRATEFMVKVPAGTRSLEGSALTEDYTLKFKTARPRVVRTQPYANFARVDASDDFVLKFNQPVSDAAVKSAVTLAVAGKPVGYAVRRDKQDGNASVTLIPSAPLPLDSAVEIRVAASLQGTEGPLPSAQEQSYSFRTYGPLLVDGLQCDNSAPKQKCSVDGGLSLQLTNAVKVGDLKKALSISPAVTIRWPSWMSDADTISSLPIYGNFAFATTYTVRLRSAGLRDEYGQALASDYSGSATFGDAWPTARIGLSGTYLEPTARKAIPVETMNLASLELVTAPLDESGILALGEQRSPPGFDQVRSLPGAKVQTIRPQGARNRVAASKVDPAPVLGKSGRGPMVIAIQYRDEESRYDDSQVSILQVTDLSISAKVSMHGSLVWVSRLSTGAPVANASVSIRGGGGTDAVYRTDAQGFVTIPESAYVPSAGGGDTGVIFARTEDDFAFRRVETQLDGYRFGAVPDLSEDSTFGMMFSDRGLYRPGETAQIKGIVREDGYPTMKTPSGKTMEVKVQGPDGDTILKASPKLSAFGTFDVAVKIPTTGRLGTYDISARLADSANQWRSVGTTVEVAEFRAAEFKVGVESDKPSYIRGDKASWTASGDFLFGAPMSGADASLSLTRAETYFAPPGTEDFVTDDGTYWRAKEDSSAREYQLERSATKLDAKGIARLSAALTMPGQHGAEAVTCEASVTDLSRQELSGSSTAIVHPAAFYLALRNPSEDFFIKSGDSIKPEVLAVDPKGAKVGGMPTKIELIKRSWTMAKVASAGGGLHSEMSLVDTTVGSCSVITGPTARSCALTPPTAGYFIVRATAADSRKNPVAASLGVYALGEGEVSWGERDSSAVELVLDKKSYEVGQTARVLVKSPFKSAEAVVTVERAGVYTHRRVTLAGATPTIDVPVTADLRPNAYVSVLLVRGRSKAPPTKAGEADVGAPAYAMGYANIAINPESRRLKVAIMSNKSDYKPGETATVDVKVKDSAGKPAKAEMTLYAVDEGVLSMIAYKTPDPIAVFGAARPLGVVTIEAREALARIYNPLSSVGTDKGLDGGGGGEGSSIRRDFRPSAYWAASLVTDADGKVHTSFKLPDSLTTYRIMAVVAAEDDRFGYGEERVTASRKLMARPAFPRLLRAGDDLEAGVILTSKGLKDSTIDVSLKADGIEAKETKRQVELPANGSIEVRFPLLAKTVGDAKLRFDVSGGGERDAVEISRAIKAPLVPEAVALYGETTTARAEALGDLSAIRGDYGGLDVSLASTALVGLGDGIDQLINYPYGCTEQLTSKLIPMLPARDLARDYKLKLPADTDRFIALNVAEILKNQRYDGGFGFWGSSPTANPWVTTYALWGLSLAKSHGVKVPDAALASATRYVRRALEADKMSDIDRATSPFTLDVLAEIGQPDPGRVSLAFEKRAQLPLFSQALLLHAMALGKSDPASIETLIGEIEAHVRLDGARARAVENTGDAYAVLMDSPARTSAIVLRALVAAKPQHPLASKLAMGLLADRRGGTWRSTQETSWALLALDDYRRAQEKAEPNFDAKVFLGQALLATESFHGRDLAQKQVAVPAAQLVPQAGAPLSFAVDGSGKLFYQATLRYSRKELPTQGLDRGFFLEKTLRKVTPESLDEAVRTVPTTSATTFNGSDLVLVDIVVVTPSPRRFVVIDDPLPAGFEAVDMRLATTGAGLDVDAAASRARRYGDDDDDAARAAGQAENYSWYQREIRDDRVLFFVDAMAAGMYHYRYLARATSIGRFVTPPARAEEMYSPEVFGRTDARVLTVQPKP